MRLMKYSFHVHHIPGKELVTADTLSRAPIRKPPTKVDKRLTEDLSLYVAIIFESLPASERKLEEIRLHQQDDENFQNFALKPEGWPDRTKLNTTLLAYWPERGKIKVQRGILMKSSLRLDTLDKIHAGHQGIRKCRERARESVWWPRLSKQIKDMITTCPTCCKHRQNHAEPMIASPLPERPWQKIATDLFHHNGKDYIIAVDYYSRFFEVAPFKNTTSENVVNHLKSFFCRHCIPEIVMSDNGPQFSAATLSKFADEWGFTHLTSSPYYPQSNGEAKRAVKTAKSLFVKSEDPYLALLSYRKTPLQNGHTPAELLMGPKLKPMGRKLKPMLLDAEQLRKNEQTCKRQQTQGYNKRHRATCLSDLSPGETASLVARNEFSSSCCFQVTRTKIIYCANGKRHGEKK